MPIRPKLIYLARRNPALTHEQFVARWRQHGALGMSMPRWKNVWRYSHCDILPSACGAPQTDGNYDGVGLLWHRSPDHRRAHLADAISQDQMEVDERETFAELVTNFCAVYEEKPIIDCGDTPRFKIFRFLKRSGDISHQDFPGEWSAVSAHLTLRARGVRSLVRRYIQNHRAEPEHRNWGLKFDLVEELWFDDLDGALQAQDAIANDASLRRMLAQNVNVSKIVTVITNEIVLYEPPIA